MNKVNLEKLKVAVRKADSAVGAQPVFEGVRLLLKALGPSSDAVLLVAVQGASMPKCAFQAVYAS